MKRILSTISLAIITTLANAQINVESLMNNEFISKAVVSMCAVTGNGQKIMDINASQMLVPASNMKLISTGAALHKLGPDFRFETALGYDGQIEDSVLRGNVYIIGGGDPTLGSTDSIASPVENIFSQWTDMLRVAGISKIDGRIIGDGSHFDQMREEPTWLMEDTGTYYGAGTTGLMFYENMQSFSVSAGSHVGDSVSIEPSYPEAPWMEFRYNCSTGKEGTGDQLYLYTSDLAPIAEIRGTFGVDRKPKRLDCSNKFPEYTCAYQFKEYLKDHGIDCAGIGDLRLDKSWSRNGEIRLLGKTYSPALERIIFETNHISNNVFAETLLRTLGKELTGSACYDSSRVATNNVLMELGLDPSTGCRVKDGSGLSRQNYVSADFLCRFLGSMMDSPYFEEYVKSLPYPGGKGSLLYNMKKVPEGLRSRIRVKSGSMNGVRCYSGYIIPTEGTRDDVIIFSLMVNNCTAPSSKVRNLLDSIMAELAKLN